MFFGISFIICIYKQLWVLILEVYLIRVNNYIFYFLDFK